MSTTEVQLVFEGTAIQQGMIDAQPFAESLVGYSQIFNRANAIVNGEASEAAVLASAPGGVEAGRQPQEPRRVEVPRGGRGQVPREAAAAVRKRE